MRREVTVWRDGATWLVVSRSPFESGLYLEDGWSRRLEGPDLDPVLLGSAVRAGLQHSASKGRLPFSQRPPSATEGVPAHELGHTTRAALESAGVLLVQVGLKGQRLRVTPMRNEGAGGGHSGDPSAPATVVERSGLDADAEGGLFVAPPDVPVIDGTIGAMVSQAMTSSAELSGQELHEHEHSGHKLSGPVSSGPTPGEPVPRESPGHLCGPEHAAAGGLRSALVSSHDRQGWLLQSLTRLPGTPREVPNGWERRLPPDAAPGDLGRALGESLRHAADEQTPGAPPDTGGPQSTAHTTTVVAECSGIEVVFSTLPQHQSEGLEEDLPERALPADETPEIVGAALLRAVQDRPT